MAESNQRPPSSSPQNERMRAPQLRAARRPAGQARRTSRAGVPLAKWRCPHALLAVPEDGAMLHFGVTLAGEHSLALSCPRCLLAIVRRHFRCVRPATVMGDSGGSGSDASGQVRCESRSASHVESDHACRRRMVSPHRQACQAQAAIVPGLQTLSCPLRLSPA